MKRVWASWCVAAGIFAGGLAVHAQASAAADGGAGAPPLYQVTRVLKIGGEGRWDYAIADPTSRLIYVSRQTHVQVVSEAGKIVADIKDTPGVHGIALAPDASCGDGTLTIVKETAPGKFTVEQTVKTRPGARTMALDTSTHTLYLPTAEFGAPEAGGRRPSVKPASFMLVVVSPVKR